MAEVTIDYDTLSKQNELYDIEAND